MTGEKTLFDFGEIQLPETIPLCPMRGPCNTPLIPTKQYARSDGRIVYGFLCERCGYFAEAGEANMDLWRQLRYSLWGQS